MGFILVFFHSLCIHTFAKYIYIYPSPPSLLSLSQMADERESGGDAQSGGADTSEGEARDASEDKK